MNEKHNIDRLFQEKFKDFEVTPPDFVWENIREELQEKKKRRVIPIWLKLSGVAAILLLGGLLTTLFFNDTENPAINAPAVVIEGKNTSPANTDPASPVVSAPNQAGPSASETGTASQNNTTTNDNNTAVAVSEESVNANAPSTQTNINNQKTNRRNTTNTALDRNSNAVAYDGNTANKTGSKRSNRNTQIQQGNAVVATSGNNQNNGNRTDKRSGNINNAATAEGIAATDTNANGKNAAQKKNTANPVSATEGIAATDNKSSIKNTDSNNPANTNGTQQKQNAVNSITSTEGVAATGNTSGTVPANAANDPASKSNVIIDKNIPVGTKVAQTAIDTNKVVPQNELEKLLEEKLKGEDKDKQLAENKKSKDRWNIRPQVAPVFYSSLSSGSPINEQFASNSKSYDSDLSYGLGVNYAVTDRISIRSGINTVNLNYSTNDIAYYASLNSGTSNIGTSKAAGFVIQPANAPAPDVFLIDGQSTQLVEGSMIQRTGYIEIPLEMSYALVNKKFGIDLIGGVSSLFLNENNVSVLSSTGMSTEVGKAQNLNNLHFSTNVGIGFKYRFFDSFQASFEPTFKYQVNAYSRDAGNFKPYFIGLYSGISFSF
ncbi:MAG: hypothetical protein DI539_03805 [Flavobacterium psychrophilum]|nr:MAG: hypothetical protein DI539_03805 [Flavobacterium psychrophilum]